MVIISKGIGCGGGGGGHVKASSRGSGGGVVGQEERRRQQQLSLLEFLLAAIRKSMVSCRVDRHEEVISAAKSSMEIGWPTNVQHITHVTFDRFHGFLGLPVEFEVEIPCRVPSARFKILALFFFSYVTSFC